MKATFGSFDDSLSGCAQVPFLLQSKLEEEGALYSKARLFFTRLLFCTLFAGDPHHVPVTSPEDAVVCSFHFRDACGLNGADADVDP